MYRYISLLNILTGGKSCLVAAVPSWATKIVLSPRLAADEDRVYIYHHHHVEPLARTSLTLFRHSSLSFIASGRSSGLHPVSSHSSCMYVRAGCPAFAWPYAGVHRSTSLMSSFSLLQHCPACLVRRTWIVFVMGGKWSYSWCLLGCCRYIYIYIYIYI